MVQTIDNTRVYVTGHSQGSVMTHQIAMYCLEIVEAVAPNDGVVDMSQMEDKVTDIVLPYMINIVDMDKHFIEGGGNYGQVLSVMVQMLKRYGITLKEEETYSQGQRWRVLLLGREVRMLEDE